MELLKGDFKLSNIECGFNNDLWNKSLEYSKKVLPTCEVLYDKRAGDYDIPKDKKMLDCLISKYSEICLENSIKNQIEKFGYVIYKGVDYNIYNGRDKNWNPDIVIYNPIYDKYINIACKVSARKYGGDLYSLDMKKIGVSFPQHTWLFQSEDKEFHRDRVKKNNIEEIAFLTIYDDKSRALKIVAWIKNDLIIDMFVLPFYKNFWGYDSENGLIGGKRAILMETCFTADGFPCGVKELEKRYNK